jgi:hypothetical protein
MMEAVSNSDTSVCYNEITPRNIPEGSDLHVLYVSFGRGISPKQDNTTQTTTNIRTISGIRTQDLSDQAIKAYASDRTAAATVLSLCYSLQHFVNVANLTYALPAEPSHSLRAGLSLSPA